MRRSKSPQAPSVCSAGSGPARGAGCRRCHAPVGQLRSRHASTASSRRGWTWSTRAVRARQWTPP
eukprot:5698382-Lingulodinium_polyedra.AAC.1